MNIRELIGPQPKCFTEAQWNEWVACAEYAPPSARSSYCEDCLPTFRLCQLQAGTCDHPEVTFHFSAINGIVGRRPRNPTQ